MYTILNPIDDVIKNAEYFVLTNDRQLYDPFMRTVEKYCSDNKVVVGGATGISTLVGDSVDKDSYSFDLYIDDTFNHARSLADLLYKSRKDSPHVPSETISVESNIKHRMFTIWVNTRPLVKLYKLDMYRNVKLVDLIKPIEVPGRFGKEKVLCMSPEMQLISVYRKLYSPYSSRDHLTYTQLIEQENKLFSKVRDITGGDPTTGGKPLRFSKQDLTKVYSMILRNMSNMIVIGDYAIGDVRDARLQLISSDNMNNLKKIVEQTVKKVLGDTYGVLFVKYDLKLPIDYQLDKFTFYITKNSDQIALLDIFNSTSYEMIPFYNRNILGSNVKVAGDFVVLRFKFVDLYTTKLILNLGTSNERFMKNKINEILDQIDRVRRNVYRKLEAKPFFVFQLENYEGIFEEENIARKKLMMKEKNYFSKYYPSMKKTTESPEESLPTDDSPEESA